MSETPYMNMTLPTVDVTPGPDYATENNAAFNVIDAHDHTSGKGVPVPTEGLNINADLDFNGFNLTSILSSRYSSQDSPLGGVYDVGCVYVSGVDLYYNDGNGVQIQLTAGGALNAASIGGIGGDYSTSNASVFYTSASKTFSLWQDTNTAALMDCGTILLRRTDIASSAAITLKASTSLSAGYTITLPIAVPGSTSFMAIDSSGNVSFTTSMGSLTLSGALVATSISATSLLSSLLPTDVQYSLGDATHNFTKLYLDNGATNGGEIYFNAGGSLFQSSADGTELIISGFTSIYPGINNVIGLGTSTRKFTFLQLGTNIGTSTPTANRLYADLIPKAWAYTNSVGTLQAGVNLTVSRSGGVGTFQYDYVFRTNMANANYGIMAMGAAGIPREISRSTSGFTIEFRDVTTPSSNDATAHSVFVIGAQ